MISLVMSTCQNGRFMLFCIYRNVRVQFDLGLVSKIMTARVDQARQGHCGWVNADLSPGGASLGTVRATPKHCNYLGRILPVLGAILERIVDSFFLAHGAG